jgi:PPOX class probable F420-dependent enzyme
MRRMSDDDALAFLAAGMPTAALATTRADGSPHVVPVWFAVDGRDLVFTCASDSVKGRNLARDPRAAVSVADDAFPYAFASVSGSVRVVRRPEDFLAWTTRIALRYVGADRADEYGRRDEALDDLLVRLTPERIFAGADVAL